MFSPYYFAARRAGPASPLEHCAVNLCLYQPGARRWTLTERGSDQVSRTADTLAIGASSLRWTGDGLVARLEERTALGRKAVRGTLRVIPDAVATAEFPLDAAGRHVWAPLAPRCRVELELEEPSLRWSGRGYLDMNRGAAPLERDFRSWTWRRAEAAHGAAVVFDTVERSGRRASLALRADAQGRLEAVEPPPVARLPRSLCRLPRPTRADAGARARVLRTLEDTPFYARTAVAGRLLGLDTVGVHETLDLDRFASGWMQALLPYRMPRE